MKIKVIVNQTPPTPPKHKACAKPNPPWWCNDTPTLNMGYSLYLIIIIGIIYGVKKIKSRHK